jgi:hypothetical protein
MAAIAMLVYHRIGGLDEFFLYPPNKTENMYEKVRLTIVKGWILLFDLFF